MKKNRQSRPISVWIFSIIIGFMAISQICSQTFILLIPSSFQIPSVQDTIDSWSIFDRISPFVLATLLLISMIMLFRLKKSSLIWFSCYLGLVTILTIQQALTTRWLENFGNFGVISAFGGILFFAFVLIYMIWLKKREILN